MELGDVSFSNRDWVTSSFIHPHPTGNRELESKVLLDGREWSVCVYLCVSTSEAVFLTFSLLTWGLLESKTHLNNTPKKKKKKKKERTNRKTHSNGNNRKRMKRSGDSP